MTTLSDFWGVQSGAMIEMTVFFLIKKKRQ